MHAAADRLLKEKGKNLVQRNANKRINSSLLPGIQRFFGSKLLLVTCDKFNQRESNLPSAWEDKQLVAISKPR